MRRLLSGNKSFIGVAWSMSATLGQTVFQLIVFVVLSRVLSPEMFGVVALATAFIDILNIVGRGGLVEVLIQKSDVTERDLNNAFYASLLIGVVLTAGLFFSSSWLADFFSTPELESIVQLLSPACLIFAVGAVYEAKLRRDFNFKQLAVRNVTASFVSGIVALVMALTGFGALALVAQRMVSTVWNVAAMVVAAKWLPKTDVNARDMRRQIAHGSTIALSSVLGAGNQRIIDLIVGYFLGATQLGYLRIAWRMLDLLMEIAVRPINNVTLTTLSKAQQRLERLEPAYVSIIRYGSALIIPTFLGFSVISKDVIVLVFGEKWVQSADLLTILSFSGLFIPLFYFKTNVLVAAGKFRHVLSLNAAEFLLSVLVVSAFAPYGLESAAAGNVVRTAVGTLMILVYLQWIADISALRCVRAAIPALVSSSLMVTAMFVFRMMVPFQENSYFGLAGAIIVGGIVYTSSLLVTDHRLLSDLNRGKP